MPAFQYHVGFQPKLHPIDHFTFQLNRWLDVGGEAWLDEVRPRLREITDYPSWCRVFVELGDAAEREGRLLVAATHLRAANFFMFVGDGRKDETRERYIRLMKAVFDVEHAAEHVSVPYQGVDLPIWRFRPRVEARPAASLKPFVFFGGFDSYVEEMFPMLTTLADHGLEAVAFEGPGQGSIVEAQGLCMIPEWHRPVGAVLDALSYDDVTLVGMSFGGCLVIRAAAFEPRVKRVVAWNMMPDIFGLMTRHVPMAARMPLRAMIASGQENLVNWLARRSAKKRAMTEWGMKQSMLVFGKASPYLTFKEGLKYRTESLSRLVGQDVLLMAGASDQIVPLRELWQQARWLTNARSLTIRVFTEAESAAAHCQHGNIPLALRTLVKWVESVEPSRQIA